MSSQKNRLSTSLAALSFGMAFVLINAFVSKMTALGLIINLAATLLIAASAFLPNPALVATFFALNLLFGPFLFINLEQAGMASLGRLDFLVAVLLITSHMALAKVSYRSMLLSMLVITIFGWVAYTDISNAPEILPAIDSYYLLLGRLACGVALYLTIRDDSMFDRRRLYGGVLYASLTLHIALSIIQLKFPITIRAGTIEAGFDFGGISLNRPVGLLEASYVFGVTTIGVWYIAWKVSGIHFRRYGQALLVIALPICVISTRSVALGCIAFALSLLWRRSFAWKTSIFALAVVTGLFVVNQGAEIANLLDQSNSTKVLLALTVVAKWLESFPTLPFFTGHGYEQAAQVAAQSSFFQLAEAIGAAYDNNVDKGVGFPIHNVYLQILFEFGPIAFLLTVAAIGQGFKALAISRSFSLSFFWCIATTHYLVHNGLFAPLLVTALLLGLRVSHDTKTRALKYG